MHSRIQSRREELIATSHISFTRAQVAELMTGFQEVELRFRSALTGAELDDMLGKLQAARSLIVLAVDGNAAGNEMLTSANAVMLHLRSRVEDLQSAVQVGRRWARPS